MIQDIIIAINESIRGCYSIESAIYYGLASTIEVNENRFPVTRDSDGRLIKICMDDKVDLQVFHKVLSVDFPERKDLTFAKKVYDMQARSRMTVILKSSINLSSPTYNPINMAQNLPKTAIIEGYSNLRIQHNSVSTTQDQDAIVNREWKRNDYSKHKCKFIVFDVNYTIRAVTCDSDCGSFLLLEDDYKLLQEDSSFILL